MVRKKIVIIAIILIVLIVIGMVFVLKRNKAINNSFSDNKRVSNEINANYEVENRSDVSSIVNENGKVYDSITGLIINY